MAKTAKCCQWLFQIINGVSMPLFGYFPTNCGASGATSGDLPLRDGGREQEDWRAWKGVDLLYMYVGGALEELITFLSISIYLQVPKAMYMKAAAATQARAAALKERLRIIPMPALKTRPDCSTLWLMEPP